VGNRFPPPTSLKQLVDVLLKKNGTKFRYCSNLVRVHFRTASVLKAKAGPTPY
jgi:hypothetical protein